MLIIELYIMTMENPLYEKLVCLKFSYYEWMLSILFQTMEKCSLSNSILWK